VTGDVEMDVLGMKYE